MEDNCPLSNCSEHDVFLFGSTTLKVNQLSQSVSHLFFKHKLGEQLTNSLSSHLHLDVSNVVEQSGRYIKCFYEKWFNGGVNCEILKVGATGWQKGRVRIKLNVCLEFCPDQPEFEENPTNNEIEISQLESPIDDIRRILTRMVNRTIHE